MPKPTQSATTYMQDGDPLSCAANVEAQPPDSELATKLQVREATSSSQQECLAHECTPVSYRKATHLYTLTNSGMSCSCGAQLRIDPTVSARIRPHGTG